MNRHTFCVAARLIHLIVSDLQIPFEHCDALDFIQHVKKTFVRSSDSLTVINAGDEVDQHTLGRWAGNPNGFSAGDEFNEAKKRLKHWFKAFPKTFVCTSNHTHRVYKAAFGIGIPSQFLRSIGEAYEAPPGWKWADEWIFNGILYEHGENVSGATAALVAATQNRMPTVIGHQHSHGGVVYSSGRKDQIWGMNTGCLIDVDAYAFEYGKKYRKKPTLGCGLVIDGIPLFIPMILNARKRWIGRTI